MNYHRL